MVQSEPVRIYLINVIFDLEEKTLTFTGDIENRTRRIPPGIHMIVMSLTTKPLTNPMAAEFPTFPVQWTDEKGTPIQAPQFFQAQWHDPQHFAIVDFNSASAETSHRFNVLVSYEGKIYGSDPTIINEPPGQID